MTSDSDAAGRCAVVHVVLSLAPGGLERLVVDWANARNVRLPGSTRIACLDEAGALAADVQPADAVTVAGAERRRFPWDRRAVQALQAVCLRAAAAPVVLHAHNLAAWQYAVLAARGTGVSVVVTQHGANVHDRGWRNRWRTRWLAARTAEVVTVSEETAQSMAAERGLSRASIRVIGNSVPLPDPVQRDRAALRAGLGLPADGVVLGCVGRLDPIKGPDRLVRAFRAAGPALAGASLVFLGDGPARVALERAAHGAAIRFAGHRSDVRALLPAFDLFVLPSRNEGVSVALLEAMAAGVPALVTDVGASRAVLGDGGWVLPEDDADWPAALARAVAALGTGEAARRGVAGRARVREAYNLESTLAAYEAVYVAAMTGGMRA